MLVRLLAFCAVLFFAYPAAAHDVPPMPDPQAVIGIGYQGGSPHCMGNNISKRRRNGIVFASTATHCVKEIKNQPVVTIDPVLGTAKMVSLYVLDLKGNDIAPLEVMHVQGDWTVIAYRSDRNVHYYELAEKLPAYGEAVIALGVVGDKNGHAHPIPTYATWTGVSFEAPFGPVYFVDLSSLRGWSGGPVMYKGRQIAVRSIGPGPYASPFSGVAPTIPHPEIFGREK